MEKLLIALGGALFGALLLHNDPGTAAKDVPRQRVRDDEDGLGAPTPPQDPSVSSRSGRDTVQADAATPLPPQGPSGRERGFWQRILDGAARAARQGAQWLSEHGKELVRGLLPHLGPYLKRLGLLGAFVTVGLTVYAT